MRTMSVTPTGGHIYHNFIPIEYDSIQVIQLKTTERLVYVVQKVTPLAKIQSSNSISISISISISVMEKCRSANQTHLLSLDLSFVF